MAIGGPDKAARLDQLRAFARCQVWSGYRGPSAVRADVLEAVSGEVSDLAEARRLADEFIAAAEDDREKAAVGWPTPTGFERLQSALDELRVSDVEVLEAVDDHWAANERLTELAAKGRAPRGIAYFTHTDIWHAVDNDMLELNVWHGDTANVAEGDDLLTFVQETLGKHGLESLFDEGRIEVTVEWQRRPESGRSGSAHSE